MNETIYTETRDTWSSSFIPHKIPYVKLAARESFKTNCEYG